MLRPDAFAVVMATGIVSIAAGDQRYRLLSAVLAVLGAVVFAVLAGLALLAVRRWDYRDLDVAMGLFTFVAACAVLATRFRDRPVVLLTLGSAAVAAWLVLTCVATRDMLSTGWPGLRDRAHGGWELASVATSGVAIVAADLSIPVAPLVLWVVAIVIYALVTWLILWRFGRRSSRFRPDHWILMGGLAIAALPVTGYMSPPPSRRGHWRPCGYRRCCAGPCAGARNCASSVGGQWCSRWECIPRRRLPPQ